MVIRPKQVITANAVANHEWCNCKYPVPRWGSLGPQGSPGLLPSPPPKGANRKEHLPQSILLPNIQLPSGEPTAGTRSQSPLPVPSSSALCLILISVGWENEVWHLLSAQRCWLQWSCLSESLEGCFNLNWWILWCVSPIITTFLCWNNFVLKLLRREEMNAQ